MENELFVGALAATFLLIWRWAFRALPDERWQIIASVPRERNGGDTWRGLNLTYYGLLIAVSTAVALCAIFTLLGSLGVPSRIMMALTGLFLITCLPAAKIVAVVVEKKRHTFTVGGASFFGFLVAPFLVWGVDRFLAVPLGARAPILPALAALAIGYALGEGMGRLACISFGCCYGKRLADCPGWVRKLVGSHACVYSGKTKKVSYEGGLEGEAVVPIQAVTSVIYVGIALAGMLFFLWGWFVSAFLSAVVVTQAWRAVSETLRADYRGEGRISSYQIMACCSIVYALVLSFVLSGGAAPTPNVGMGLRALWDPGMLLFVQFVAVAVFLYTGRSMVTGAVMSFHVQKDRI